MEFAASDPVEQGVSNARVKLKVARPCWSRLKSILQPIADEVSSVRHLPNTARYIFDNDPSTYHRLMARADAGEINLTEVIEARFLERWSYCGVDLKLAEHDYVLPGRIGRDHRTPITEVCGDCLGHLDELRGLQGLPPLCDMMAVVESE